MSSKTIATVVIVIIIGGVITALAFMFGDIGNSPQISSSKNSNNIQSEKQATNTSTTDKEQYEELTFPNNSLDTSDWETYRNEEFGFAVDHPKGWEMREYAHPKGLFAFYHSRYHGSDNGIYINAMYDGEFVYDSAVHTKVTVNDLHGHFASQGIPKTKFSNRGIVLKNSKAENDSPYSIYFFEDPQNPGDLDYGSVFEQMLLSFRLID